MLLERGVAIVAIAALATGGCLILPETRKTEIRRYHHDSEVKTSKAKPVVMVRPDGPQLWVQAEWKRTCTIWRSEIAEYKIEKEAELADLDLGGGGGGGGGEAVLAVVVVILILAPLTLLVSGIVTGIIVSKSDAETRREVKSQKPMSAPCDAAGADFQLRASVRGQPDVAATTDAHGRARILLPAPTSATAAHPIVVHTDAPAGVAPIVIHRGPPGAR